MQLVARRARRVRLSRQVVDYLLAFTKHTVEVIPTFQRGIDDLTVRDVVGWLDTPGCRLAIHPKIPWPNIGILLGAERATYSDGAMVESAPLLNGLAREFAVRLQRVRNTRTKRIALE